MKNNEHCVIELKCTKSLPVVNGRPAGKKCYEEQIKQYVEHALREDVRFTIVFPQHVQLVSSSYLQGMFEVIYGIIGIDGIKEKFIFKHSTGRDLMKDLIDALKLLSY